jgi:hypothetical protein
MARELALRLRTTTHHVDQRVVIGHRAPFITVDAVSTCISCIRQTPYQAEHTHFGSTWRIRKDWTSYEVFGRNGHLLQIQKVLATFDLQGYLERHHK